MFQLCENLQLIFRTGEIFSDASIVLLVYTHIYTLSGHSLLPSSFFLSLKVSMSLAEFHDWAKEAVRVACENALTSEHFVPDPIEEQRPGRSNNKVTQNHLTLVLGSRSMAAQPRAS